MTVAPITLPGDAAPVVRRGVAGQLLRRPLAVVSLAVLAVLIVVAVVQPLITPYPPEHVELRLTNAPPFTSHYLLGGDKFGRDILSLLIAGTRGAMVAGFILTSIALVLGIVFGLIAGYVQGVVDVLLSAVFAILIAVPGIILLIALYTLVEVSMPVAMATLGVLSSTGIFLLVRSLTRTVRGELYVDAARVSGLPAVRIIGRHVLLAIRGPVIILAAFLCGGALAVSAGLDFLGLGDPRQPSWGSVLNDAFINYYVAPWQLIWPGLVLGVAMAAFVLLGNALRDVLEGTYITPSARGRRLRQQRLVAATFGTSGAVGASGTFGTSGAGAPAVGGHAGSPVLQIRDLAIGYPDGDRLRLVVEQVALSVGDGEIVGIVGESGSGKSQTVFSALGLLPEQAVVARGSIRFEGRELVGASEREWAAIRGTGLAYVPQEPMSNLDPSFRVGDQLVEGIRAQTGATRRDARELALAMLDRVGIRDPRRTFRSYPHEISGGMAQRVLIAGAVANRPRLLIADEPTTALDVTVQAEVLDLLRDLQAEMGMGVLIVTHNLGVVADLCDRVVVMHDGRVVESGDVRQVLTAPAHDYTRSLLSALLDDAPRPELAEEASRG